MIACRFCGRETRAVVEGIGDYEHHTAEGFGFAYCSNCAVAQRVPPAPRDELPSYYPDDYHAYRSHSSALARYLKRRYFERRAARIRKLLGDGEARILDVGVSNGDFLSHLGEGRRYELHGTDLNARVLTACPSRIRTYHGYLEDLSLPSETFDAVILNNLIEHTTDPAGTMNEIYRVLKPGGLVFGETPNFDALERPLFARYWGGFHAPRHTFLFTPRALAKMAKRSGLEITQLWAELQPAHWAISVQNFIEDRARRWHRLRGGRNQYFVFLLVLFVPLNVLQNWIGRPTNLGFLFRKPLSS